MCGNAVVLKPATETPLSGLHLARALHDAGLPAGVLNVITGRISEIGDALVDDTRIAAVSFTGSNQVGEARFVRVAARSVRFQADMGGKNASVVLADADLDVSFVGVVASSFGGAGKRCTATSRVIVNRAIVHEFFARLEVDRGQIAVNTSTSGWGVHLPFGGFRRSGSPFEEQGGEAINFHTRVKTVAICIPPTSQDEGGS